MIITKTFVQIHTSHDCEGRYWNWEDTTDSYEEIAKELATEWNGWLDSVRIVEKAFNTDSFTTDTKVIKMTKRTYKGFAWDGGVEETIY